MAALTVGTRVVLNRRCVWPPRRGCKATIVDPPDPRQYPAPLQRGEVLVLLDDDPIAKGRRRTAFGDGEGDDRERGWTCVVRRGDVEVITDAEPEQ
jgi:hypothetical protein